MANGHAPGVVASILELLEPAHYQICRVLITSDVAEDSAHGAPPARRCGADGEGRGGVGDGSYRPAGTLSGLCRHVTAPVCSTISTRAAQGTYRQTVGRSPPRPSSLPGEPVAAPTTPGS